MAVYYKDDDAFQPVYYCIISDDNKHDVGVVHQVQREIIIDLKLRFPYTLALLFIFLMGVQANIKTVKICITCHHKLDYNRDAKWVFFTTSNGKQPFDGIEGTVKQLVSYDMFQYCKNNIQGIKFIFIT